MPELSVKNYFHVERLEFQFKQNILMIVSKQEDVENFVFW